jgi:hypothetical protein
LHHYIRLRLYHLKKKTNGNLLLSITLERKRQNIEEPTLGLFDATV